MSRVPMWSAGDILRNVDGMSYPQIRRYATIFSYPAPGSGNRHRYLHRDVEIMATFVRLQRAMTGDGPGGVTYAVLDSIAEQLAVEDTAAVTVVDGVTLLVERVHLENPMRV